MLISAHGTFNKHMDAVTKKRGFTLVEVLVVMLIMGMMLGLASAIVRPDDSALLNVEAERLSHLLELAMEESSFSGKSIAWTSDSTGYQFWRMNRDGEWIVLNDNDLLHARSLPSGMRITRLQIENMPARGNMRLEFSPYSTATSFSIDMSLGTARHVVKASPIGELQVSQTDRTSNENISN